MRALRRAEFNAYNRKRETLTSDKQPNTDPVQVEDQDKLVEKAVQKDED